MSIEMSRQNQNTINRFFTVMAGDKIDTIFGEVTVIERKDGEIHVFVDDDITATFNEDEFFSNFVL